MKLGRHLITTALAIALSVSQGFAAGAAANPHDVYAAQQAFRDGTVAEYKRDWRGAREAFQRSIDLNDTPRARVHLARAETKLGHLIEAFGHYQAALDSKSSDYTLKATARKEQKEIGDRTPNLTVKVPRSFSGSVVVDDVALTADAYNVPFQVNPGTRVVTAESDGFRPFHKSVVVLEHGNAVVELELIPAPKTRAKDTVSPSGDGHEQTIAGYLSLGLGAVGLAVGAGFGLASYSAFWSVRDSCTGNVCSEDVRGDYNRGKKLANVSTGGFIAAGVFTGLGVTLLLTRPDTPAAKKSAVSLALQPTGVSVLGRF